MLSYSKVGKLDHDSWLIALCEFLLLLICFSWSSLPSIFLSRKLANYQFCKHKTNNKKHKQHHSTTQLLHPTPPKLVSKTNMSGSTDLLLHRAICRIQGIKSLVQWLSLTYPLKLDAWKMLDAWKGTFVNCLEGVCSFLLKPFRNSLETLQNKNMTVTRCVKGPLLDALWKKKLAEATPTCFAKLCATFSSHWE